MRRLLLAGALLVCQLGALSASAQANEAFVRVNQVGYAATATKRAYLMSSVTESGATFAVRRVSDSATVFKGTVGAPLGPWSAAFPDVYALDFDALSA